MLNDPEPYESSIADVKILEEEIFPINDVFQKVFGSDKEFKLNSIKLAIGSNFNDYVTIGEVDLIHFDVKPTLTGLDCFIKENKESILGFLDCEYVSEEGNVIYLNCSKKNVSENIFSIKLMVLASMQQRGFFLQQEHKYYGLQLYIVIESKKSNDNKLLEFLKELGIDWEVIFFRRKLAIHDWTEIECERNSENLKSYLRAKFETLNYFDVNNIIRLAVKNQLPFKVADKMASLLYKMKNERNTRIQDKKYPDEQYQQDEYSITLKKAEVAAAAKLACAYLGIHIEMNFDRDISMDEILKYEEELTNI
ncbi:hypothetical protein LCGC14_0674980 [marine sediment metagenome]|uniref:Uncharacterized protein n=1 Tax=marine sediment metagenome TaxID=412755 RepID=A0A0F9RA35_9ZZZZ|nr:MAG: hypothetical protein Lokiarch_17810 [Candidatus Lokiarchaeum sp. GC14_75]HEC37049.1 hypothetical protein [bacterium]